jgi:hypothetical protein
MTPEAKDIPTDTNWEIQALVDGRSLEPPWWSDHSKPLVIKTTSNRIWKDNEKLKFSRVVGLHCYPDLALMD